MPVGDITTEEDANDDDTAVDDEMVVRRADVKGVRAEDVDDIVLDRFEEETGLHIP